MHDDTPESRALPSKAPPAPALTEAELSRIAREAVHQPADARLDKQLVRMGLMDAAESAEPEAAAPARHPVAVEPDLERLREELRRTRMLLSLLVGVIVVLAVLLVALLVR